MNHDVQGEEVMDTTTIIESVVLGAWVVFCVWLIWMLSDNPRGYSD